MNKYLKSKSLKIILILLVLDGLFYGLSNPNSLNLVILILGILLFSINIFYCTYLIIILGKKFGYYFKNPLKLSLVFTIFTTFILSLQTLGQLTLKDFVVSLILGILIYLYLQHIHPRAKKN